MEFKSKNKIRNSVTKIKVMPCHKKKEIPVVIVQNMRESTSKGSLEEDI